MNKITYQKKATTNIKRKGKKLNWVNRVGGKFGIWFMWPCAERNHIPKSPNGIPFIQHLSTLIQIIINSNGLLFCMEQILLSAVFYLDVGHQTTVHDITRHASGVKASLQYAPNYAKRKIASAFCKRPWLHVHIYKCNANSYNLN